MKRLMINLIILSALALLTPQTSPAQGTVYVSNLNQPSTAGAPVASDSWFAESFETGTNPGGYTLNSIQLMLGLASGNPGGFGVSIYSENIHKFPGDSLASLTGSTSPAAGGLFNYAASDVALLPSAYYFIVITAATPVAAGSYSWSVANNFTYSSADNWVLGPYYYASADGSVWTRNGHPFEFVITATAVPEPSSLMLLGLGGLMFLGLARRKAKAVL